VVYLVLAVGSVEVNWERVYDGLERGQRFIMGFLQPDFTSRWRDISQGLVESLTMTLTSTVVGVAISIPIGIGAARNIAPRVIYYICRRSSPSAVRCRRSSSPSSSWRCSGSARFAGFLTLTFATIGFIAKLLADDIEEIDEAQTEAVRSTGASWMAAGQLRRSAAGHAAPYRPVALSSRHQFPRKCGDRDRGAGGIGATLNTAIDRYEYDSAGAILLIIIAIVMVAEYGSSYLRKFLQ
jgi:phosphonate transport system permease protein